MRWIFRRLYEYRLRKVEFAGQPLHHLLVEPVGIADHRQRISGKARRGEHIERVKRKPHTSPAAQRAKTRSM
jgi:hypothetical protein